MKEEIQRQLDAYIDQIPDKMKQLKVLYAENGGDAEDLDLSPESLVPLWRWFISTVKTVQLSNREFRKKKKQCPEYTWEYLDDWEIERESLSIAMDIGIYFGKVIIAKYPKMKWGIFELPKHAGDVIEPVLVHPKGGQCCPSRILRMLTTKAAEKNSSPEELYEALHENTKRFRAFTGDQE